MSAGYNVTFLENKVLEVNNGTGFIEGGVFWSTCAIKNGSRPSYWLFLWI
jgi:hypothetical protein